MEDKTIKAIIFDFFGVISSVVAPRWFGENLSDGQLAEISATAVGPVDRGEISETEFFQRIADAAHKTPSDVRSEWLSLASIDHDLVDYIRTIHDRYKIAICSNAPAPFLREIIEQ